MGSLPQSWRTISWEISSSWKILEGNWVKNDVKIAITLDENNTILNNVKTVVKQGKFLEVTEMLLMGATCKSHIYNLPKGTLKWLLNSNIDTLPNEKTIAKNNKWQVLVHWHTDSEAHFEWVQKVSITGKVPNETWQCTAKQLNV